MQGGDHIYHRQLSFDVVGVLYSVYNELGYGYNEKTYEKAIAKIFSDKGINYREQLGYNVVFRGEIIAINYLDFVVENKIVLELKRGNYFSSKNIDQIKKYLAVTGLQLAILAQFASNGVKIFRALNINNR